MNRTNRGGDTQKSIDFRTKKDAIGFKEMAEWIPLSMTVNFIKLNRGTFVHLQNPHQVNPKKPNPMANIIIEWENASFILP